MSSINLCGLECPQPVIKTKTFLEKNSDAKAICVVVDNKAASENVSRFLSNQGFSTKITLENNLFQVKGSKDGAESQTPEVIEKQLKKTTTIFISNQTIGSGNAELGEKLMLNFIKTLSEMKESLWRLIFVNEGVKLTVSGAEALPVLQELESEGISILVCGTCLEFFNLLDKKMTGETTNMLDIITSLQVSDKVINL